MMHRLTILIIGLFLGGFATIGVYAQTNPDLDSEQIQDLYNIHIALSVLDDLAEQELLNSDEISAQKQFYLAQAEEIHGFLPRPLTRWKKERTLSVTGILSD